MPNTIDVEPRPCEHCGRLLEPRSFDLCGHETFCGWEACDCEGAEQDRLRFEQEQREHRKTAEEVAWQRRLDASGIPPRFKDADHPWAQRLANRVEEGKGFYIHGKNGTGKTELACAAGIILMERGYNVNFQVATKLLEELRAFSDESKQLLKRLSECDVLIIDDLGKEGASTPRAAEKLFDIFNDRYNADTRIKRKPVIVTSNFTRGQVASAVSEGGAGVAIASRLAEMTQTIQLEGEDRRIQHGKD